MKNSWQPSMVTGFGGCNARVGKRLSLFSWKGLTSDVWKTGNARDCSGNVTFGLNVRLDLSRKATTKLLCPLCTKLVLQVLGESTRAMTIRMIRGDEGVGDIPGVRGVQGFLKVLCNLARLTQELRIRVRGPYCYRFK